MPLVRLVAGALAGTGLRVLTEANRERPVHLAPHRWAAVQAITLEALRNVRKHAHATEVRVRLDEDHDGGTVTVQDDGCGFDPATSRGFGLAAARRRAETAGLSLRVTSRPHRGTRVEIGWTAARDSGVGRAG
jgi:signal transduction histidine kinase